MSTSSTATELPADAPRVGLIAGGGTLPLLQARGMRAAGYRVIGIGLRGQYDPKLPALCDEFYDTPLLRIARWAKNLRRSNCHNAVMVGYVSKTLMYHPWQLLSLCPDLTMLHLFFWTLRKNRRSQYLLTALCDTLQHKGVTLMDTTKFIPEHLATLGSMGRHQPSSAQQQDIQMAIPILRQLNELDVGQGLCVKDGDVIALEAMEGTDRMLARCHKLCPKGGWTLVKGCTPSKDLRFDVPTVGISTLENLKQHGGTCLAVAAERTLMVNKPELIAKADELGIAIIGIEI